MHRSHHFARLAIFLALSCLVSACQDPPKDLAAEMSAGPSQTQGLTKPSAAVSESAATKGRSHLLGPRWEDWKPDPPAVSLEVVGLGAEAFHFKGIVYERADKDAKSTGVIRRGRRIAVKERVFGSGCEGGGWYGVEPYGFVCSKDGFWVSKTARDPEPDASPYPQRRVPYEYVKVTTDNAPRFFRVPNRTDLAAARTASRGDAEAPDVVEKMMDGIYLLALRPKTDSSGFRRTVRGRYVAEEDVEARPNVPMQGERLDDAQNLPLAFVYGEDRKLFRIQDGVAREAGTAEKHARAAAVSQVQVGSNSYVEIPDGYFLPREGVRLARLVSRPERIPAGKKWIHIHLPEQTLVAYEGEQPVYASLVSSGQEGFETPAGVYQVQHKYLSVTMNGPDPDEGFYEVEEVPWTMYYFESFALHGAYWHNDFGKVRSHGCTNIPPADARWLYYWSDPKVPDGWHAATRSPGTYIYISDDEDLAQKSARE